MMQLRRLLRPISTIGLVRRQTGTRLAPSYAHRVRQLATTTPTPTSTPVTPQPPKSNNANVNATPLNKPSPPTSSSSAAASAASPASGSTSSNSSNNNKNGTSSSSTSSTPPPFPSLVTLSKMSQVDLAAVLIDLPIFRASCHGSNRSGSPTTVFTTTIGEPIPPQLAALMQNSSDTCEGVLGPKLSGWERFRVLYSLVPPMCRYVKVTRSSDTNRLDFEEGAEQALLAMSEKFNTFHLEESRDALRLMTKPNVFKALEQTWQLLDAQGLRLQWKVEILDSYVRQFCLHDMGPIDDMFGGLMMKVPPAVGAPGGPGTPTSGSNNSTKDSHHQFATLNASDSNKSASDSTTTNSAPGSSTSSTSSAVPTNLKSPRYLDLDVQYYVVEDFEIFTTRADQIVQPAATQTVMSKDAADAVLKSLKSLDPTHPDQIQAFLSSALPSLTTPTPSSSTLDRIVSQMNEAVMGASTVSTESKPIVDGEEVNTGTLHAATNTPNAIPSATTASTPVPPKSTVAPTSTSTTASSASPSSSSSTSTPKSTPPPMSPQPLNFLPPLTRIAHLRLQSDRGLRFWTSLPKPQPSPPHFVCSPPIYPFLWYERVAEWFQIWWFKEMRNPPTPNWFIKDIID